MDRTALLPDNFTDVLFGNTQFEYHGVVAANGSDMDIFGSVDQGLG
jgi:hypothetical protein